MGDDIDDEYFDFSASNGEEIVADLIDSEGLSAKSGFQVNEGDATLSLKDNDAELSTSTGKRRAELSADLKSGALTGEEDETSQKKKKKKKKDKPPSAQSNSQLLITTGRTITSRPLPAHCAFFNAAYLPTLAEAGFQGVEGLTVDKFVGTPIQSTTKIEGERTITIVEGKERKTKTKTRKRTALTFHTSLTTVLPRSRFSVPLLPPSPPPPPSQRRQQAAKNLALPLPPRLHNLQLRQEELRGPQDPQRPERPGRQALQQEHEKGRPGIHVDRERLPEMLRYAEQGSGVAGARGSVVRED